MSLHNLEFSTNTEVQVVPLAKGDTGYLLVSRGQGKLPWKVAAPVT